jgi:septal ring factor EnvC (AmiA/AmiB activator)
MSAQTGKSGNKNTLMYIVTGVLVVALLVIGVFYGTGVGKLNTANANISELTINVENLGTQLSTAQANAADLQIQLTAAKANAADLQNQLTSTKSDLSASNAKVTSLTSDVAAANAKVISLTSDLATANGKVTTVQASLDKANSDLTIANGKVSTLQSQLTTIQAKYPLKDFPDVSTLTAWAKAHILPSSLYLEDWYKHALQTQTSAMNDGYFVSANYYMTSSTSGVVYNLALVSTTLYRWDPEIGTLTYYSGTFVRP